MTIYFGRFLCNLTAFISVLISNDVTISMDGRGRALDNIFVERLWRTVKYEEVYLKQHDCVQSLLMGLTDYLDYLTTTTEIGSNIGLPIKLFLSNKLGAFYDSQNLINDNFTSLWTQRIVAADLNNDGLQDVVIGAAPEQGNASRVNTSNHLNWGCPQYVLFQNIDGTFTPVQTISTTFEAHSINVADFNNDGFADILYVSDINGANQPPKLLLNTGKKSFVNADLSNLIGLGDAANNFHSFYSAVGDFNNDGNQDIIFLNGGFQHGQFDFIAFGKGNGEFEKGPLLPMVPDSMGGEYATRTIVRIICFISASSGERFM